MTNLMGYVSLALIELGIRWEGYVARMGKLNTCTLLVKQKTKWKELIEMPRRRWDDNIETDLENRMTGNELDSFV